MKNYKAPVLSGIVTEILQAKGKLELTGNVWRYRNSIIIIIIKLTERCNCIMKGRRISEAYKRSLCDTSL